MQQFELFLNVSMSSNVGVYRFQAPTAYQFSHSLDRSGLLVLYSSSLAL